MGIFLDRYASRVVIYDCRAIIRLAIDLMLQVRKLVLTRARFIQVE